MYFSVLKKVSWLFHSQVIIYCNVIHLVSQIYYSRVLATEVRSTRWVNSVSSYLLQCAPQVEFSQMCSLQSLVLPKKITNETI